MVGELQHRVELGLSVSRSFSTKHGKKHVHMGWGSEFSHFRSAFLGLPHMPAEESGENGQGVAKVSLFLFFGGEMASAGPQGRFARTFWRGKCWGSGREPPNCGFCPHSCGKTHANPMQNSGNQNE